MSDQDDQDDYLPKPLPIGPGIEDDTMVERPSKKKKNNHE
jgi:hypothetical protein